MREFGVHSEVGKLRTVMVCRPGLAHQRLTPGNCHELLFDDVIWVHEAQKDHYDFVLKMRERGVEVLELHDLLAETLDDTGGAQLGARPAHHRQRRRRRCSRRSCGPGSTRCRPTKLARAPDRRHRDRSTCRERHGRRRCWREALRRHRLHPAAGPEHAVPARPVLLDLRRRDLQPDVLAGAQARDAAAARRLQVPPALHGRRLQDLVGRLRRGLRAAPRSRAATSCRSARASC